MRTKTAHFALGILLAASMAFAKAPSNGAPQLSTVEQHVRHQLVSLPYLTVFDNLAFRVDNGTVTLFGQVTQPWLKADAEKSLKHVEGVARVDNQIEVLPLSTFDDQIRLRTFRALARTPGLEPYFMGVIPSIRIIVKNGHVTLVGLVSRDMDRTLAYLHANGIPGVFSVTNELQVEK